ncbi:16S rRNA (guanine(527)-N(7))-methyltransferase RsmG [Paracoccus indicus]|uniref:16S rRNA (guanine(527)-N(7))-methyltransferase RsmG n=1 Tax=Paracoccus indicus TaxID=2079229 RepID=UPI000D38D0A0|nr:16S rRNA (guanine(527)-N(7))-methyltransferase RsmG [Paracoccus indicus]
MTDVSRETELLFEKYRNLMATWNPKINLVASSTLGEFRERHIEDCLQIVSSLPKYISGKWVDIGSGGGLPGLVLAIYYREQSIDFSFVESDKRKCQFLRTVIRELGLENVDVISERIEEITPLNADYLSARALAALPKLLGFVERHLGANGKALLMKGRSWQEEVELARKEWHFELEHSPSTTDAEAAILKVSGVSHA